MLTTKTPLLLLHFADGRQRISTGLNTRNTCSGLHIYTLSTEVWFLKKCPLTLKSGQLQAANSCCTVAFDQKAWFDVYFSTAWVPQKWLFRPLPSFEAFSASVRLRGGRGLVFRVGGGVHDFQKQLKMGAHFFWWEMVMQFLPLQFFLLTTTILIIDSNTFLTKLISPQDLLLQRFWNLCWILYNRITNFNCGKISNPGKFSFLHVTFSAILNYQAYYTTPRALGLILPWD